jgi:hypothetical protein
LRDANTWKEEDEQFEVVSDEEDWRGVGWSRRGLSGRLEYVEGDELMWRGLKRKKKVDRRTKGYRQKQRTMGLAPNVSPAKQGRDMYMSGIGGQEDVEMRDVGEVVEDMPMQKPVSSLR